jgi:hypothetical protein
MHTWYDFYEKREDVSGRKPVAKLGSSASKILWNHAEARTSYCEKI